MPTPREQYLAYLTSQGYTPVRAVLFEEGTGDPVEFYTSTSCGTVSSPGWSAPSGYTAGDDVSDGYWQTPGGADVMNTADVTILIVRRRHLTTAISCSLFGTESGGAGQRCGAHVPFSDGTVYFDFGGTSSPNRLTWAGYSRTSNIEAWAFRAGSAGSSIWLDGTSRASQGTGVTRTASISTAWSINHGNGLGSDDEDILFAAIVNHYVSDAVLGTFTPTNVLDPGFFSGTDEITPGALELMATQQCISVRAPYEGDANGNATCTARYRETVGPGAWKDIWTYTKGGVQLHPMIDRRETINATAIDNTDNVLQARFSIFGLAPATSYDVKVSWTDADGGSADVSASITTLSYAPASPGTVRHIGSGQTYANYAAALAAASPGDIFEFHNNHAALNITSSGTAGNYYKFRPAAGASVTIGTTGDANQITVNANYINITEGTDGTRFTLAAATGSSVKIVGGKHDIFVERCYTTDYATAGASSTYYGFVEFTNAGNCDHVFILDNEATYTGTAHSLSGPWVDGVIMYKGHTIVIAGNTFSSPNGGIRDGIGNGTNNDPENFENVDIFDNEITGQYDDGIEIDGACINVRVWGNAISSSQHDADNGAPDFISTSAPIVGPAYVLRNTGVFTSTGAYGFKESTNDVAPEMVTAFYLHNSVNTSGAPAGPHETVSGSKCGLWLNNAFRSKGNIYYACGDDSAFDYNIGYSSDASNWVGSWNGSTDYAALSNFVSATTNEDNGIDDDPDFLDSDLRLTVGSPAIDAGLELPNINDADSAWPFVGDAPDMGAREFGDVTDVVGSFTASNKVYDGTTAATVTSRSLTPDPAPADCTLSGGTATFSSKTIGTGKAVTLSGATLAGTDAPDFNLTSVNTTTANITAKTLTVTGITASNKTYNGNTTATLSTGSAALVGVVGGDDVTLVTGSATGTFANKNIGTGKTVTVAGLTLSGADAGNYSLTQPTTTANITAIVLTLTGAVAANKTYNGNTTATVNFGSATLVGVLGGETVGFDSSGYGATFANKNIGTGKTVAVTGVALTGADAGNYTLTQPSLTANITALALTISGAVANDKAYNGSTTATVDFSGASLLTPIGGDTVTIDSSGYTATFADPNVGTNIAVTVLGVTLAGGDAGNYTVSQPSGLTADITAGESMTVTKVLGGAVMGTNDHLAVTKVGGAMVMGTNDHLAVTKAIAPAVLGTHRLTVTKVVVAVVFGDPPEVTEPPEPGPNRGFVYRMAMDIDLDLDDRIRRERIAPHLSSENRQVIVDALEMDAEVGTAPIGETPQVILQISADGGMTWGLERWASSGLIGRYLTRLRWLRLGQGRDRVYRVITTMRGPVRWLNAFLRVRGGKDGA